MVQRLFKSRERFPASKNYKGFSHKRRLELLELASVLKSLEHPARYILVEVLSRQPQPICVVFGELNAAIKKKARDIKVLSFSSLAFHLSILERSKLVQTKKVRQEIKSPKGYPITTECHLTPLGLYVKKNLPLFTQYAETIKRLSGNIKSYHGWVFDAFTFLSIANAYNGQETKIEVAKLKSICKDSNAYYYLKRIEERNSWLLVNRAGRRKCVEINYIPKELSSSIKILNSMKTETSFLPYS